MHSLEELDEFSNELGEDALSGLTKGVADTVFTPESLVKALLEYCENSIESAQADDLLSEDAGRIVCEIVRQKGEFELNIQENGFGLTKTALELQLQHIGASKTEQSDAAGLWLIAPLRLNDGGYMIQSNPRTEPAYEALLMGHGAEILDEEETPPREDFFGTRISIPFSGSDITAPALGEVIREVAQDCAPLVEYNICEKTENGKKLKQQFHL